MKTWLSVLVIAFFIPFAHKDLSWVAIGDSITYLNDHANETGNRVEKGYLTRVTEALPYLHYTNQGHNGWTVIRIAQEIEKLGIVKADVYTIFLGTNDWWKGNPLGTLEDYKNNTGTGTAYGAFRVIVNKLRSLNPDAKIVLITPMQRVDFVYINNAKNNAWGSYRDKNGQQLSQFADAVDSIGNYEHFPTADLYHKSGMTLKTLVKYKRLKDPKTGVYTNYTYPGYIDIPFNPETDEYPYPAEAAGMTYDGLHPSDKGNAVIAKMLVKILKRY
ncbi:MAG: SGNH/GDSL hydrolase family protein [Bacteroidetes bacterium]|nr:SGNH/GDSL hydrolase family protein [Bacteroidota bacterium]